LSQPVAKQIDAIQASMMPFAEVMFNPAVAKARAHPDASDFMAGNPQELALPAFVDAMQRWAVPADKDWYGYKMADHGACRAAAGSLGRETGMTFDPEDILLQRGAHGGLATSLKVVVDPGDEVIYISPPWFFYEALIIAAGATPVRVNALAPDFDLPVELIAAAITPRTRAVIVNTPNNPTGRIYPPGSLQALATVLREASARNDREVYIVSDEAYSRILFSGAMFHTPARYYPHTFMIHTYSKSALAPGQRLGYVALPPEMPNRPQLRFAFMAAAFGTGTGMPDAIMQYALAEIDAMSIDLAQLQRKRDRMVSALSEMGYEVNEPEGTFYILGRSPQPDAKAFAFELAEENVILLPGDAFEMPGYFRISLTATDAMIDRSLPAFARAIERTRAVAKA
jgi:aspartate aminotransferase